MENHGYSSTIASPGINQEVYKCYDDVGRRDDLLLSVGWSHYLKNLDYLLDGWRGMKTKPKLELFRIEPRLGKKNGVKYYYKPNDIQVARLYNRATVFAQTSLHEGFCLPILEAMACGCPVVCTDADGNLDFCVDGKNCLIVAKDDVNALTGALESLLRDEGLRERLSREGKRTAEKYVWDMQNTLLEAFMYDLK
ncbi:glycosyltransferase family 4 protein [Patescibacteria group bacterium]|nr:glycosyltransferase family 4 protein [Patescibacteria group bacterium]